MHNISSIELDASRRKQHVAYLADNGDSKIFDKPRKILSYCGHGEKANTEKVEQA